MINSELLVRCSCEEFRSVLTYHQGQKDISSYFREEVVGAHIVDQNVPALLFIII